MVVLYFKPTFKWLKGLFSPKHILLIKVFTVRNFFMTSKYFYSKYFQVDLITTYPRAFALLSLLLTCYLPYHSFYSAKFFHDIKVFLFKNFPSGPYHNLSTSLCFVVLASHMLSFLSQFLQFTIV